MHGFRLCISFICGKICHTRSQSREKYNVKLKEGILDLLFFYLLFVDLVLDL